MAKGGNTQPAQGPVYGHDQQAIDFEGQLRNQQLNQSMIDANRQRYADLGRGMGQEYFGHGTMPRVQEGRTQEMSDLLGNYRALNDVAGQRSGATQDVLNRQYAGLGGYTAPQYGALRQQAYQGFQNQMATGQRDLLRSQANNRVTGDAAQAGMQRFQQQGAAAAANAERDLMVNNIQEQQNRLNAYNQNLQGVEGTQWGRQTQALEGLRGLTQSTEADELSRQQYNNQQYNRETAGQLQSMLGMMGLGAGDLSTSVRTALAQQQMTGALNGGGGGKGGGK